MRRLIFFIVMPLFFSSCISYHVTEKDIFNVTKVSRVNKDLNLQEVYINEPDSVQLYGLFVKQKNPRGTFIYFGGDGFIILNRLTTDIINTLTSFNMNLLLIDYRGCGQSTGDPTIRGLYNDGEAAYRYICSRLNVDTTKIILYGHSYGGFVAANVGVTHKTAGIILEAPISTAQDMSDAVLAYYAPWYIRWLVSISADSVVMGLNNLEQAAELKQPLLIVTGEKDWIAPPEMGKKVYEAAGSVQKEFEIVPGGQHKNLYFSNEDGRRDFYIKTVGQYLDKVIGPH